jgi:hypothetical protein
VTGPAAGDGPRHDPWWSSEGQAPGADAEAAPDAPDPGGADPDPEDGHGAGDGGPDLDPRLQAGLDHLQRAAREVIAASRALLDVAEELVDDPKAAAGVVDLLGSLGTLAARRARAGGWPTGGGRGDGGADGGGSGPDDGDEGEPPVQRIPVS